MQRKSISKHNALMSVVIGECTVLTDVPITIMVTMVRNVLPTDPVQTKTID